MRTFGTPLVRLGSWGIVGASAALLLFTGGCPDALNLENTSTSSTSGAGTGGTGGSGGGSSSTGGSTACVSNSDCATPTAVCDTAKHECVECLEISDCAFRPGTVCSLGQCACPNATESYCENPTRCVDLQTAGNDCGACGKTCFGACVMGKCADAWEPTPAKNAPSARSHHVAVWTGSKMIVWGGNAGTDPTNTGGMLDLAANQWTATSTSNVPAARRLSRAVWTGTHMVVWGGQNGANTRLNTGAVFNPMLNTWTTMSTQGAPSPRWGHTMVWTGQKVLVWGGFDGTNYLPDGAVYDVVEDKWDAIGSAGTPPTARADHSAVWTGAVMVIFGGYGFNGVEFTYLSDGAEFDPLAGSWALVKDGQPSPRSHHGVDWTGTEMIVWGGRDSLGLSPTGASYKPGITWSVMTTDGAPELREYHTALWIAPRLIIWGGQNAAGGYINTGALYKSDVNSWSTKPIPTAPSGRAFHSAINASGKMVIWGGMTADGLTNTGGILDPSGLP